MNPFRKQQPQIIYTPFDLSDATPAGRRRFWKQVLPDTTINYKGQRIKFDRKYHMDLAQSFKDEAFDQVPVVFANEDNAHNMDPRNFGGDVLDMQVRPKGLYALIEADEEAAKAIEKNPKLGVSARIRQMVEKADGRKFGKAIEHICLTMNPRVTGMEPWQAVDLSDEDADIEVVDLTAEDYEEGKDMAKSTTRRTRRAATSTTGTIDLSALSDEQFEHLLDLSQTLQGGGRTDEDDEEDLDEEDLDEDLDEVEEPVRRPRRKKSKTKVTIEKDSEDDGGEDDEDEDDLDTDLSDADKVLRSTEVSQFQQMRIDLAEERWGRERDGYIEAGVPPFLLDLAEPLLAQPDAVTIDLSDDETVDATAVIRQMLDGVRGVVDLTGEIGHAVDLSTDDKDDETTAFLNAWDEQYG